MGIKIRRPSGEIGPIRPTAVMPLLRYADQFGVTRTTESKTSRRKASGYAERRRVLRACLFSGLTQGGDKNDLQ
jgi:hypothetical protein